MLLPDLTPTQSLGDIRQLRRQHFTGQRTPGHQLFGVSDAAAGSRLADVHTGEA
ncbi:hypothetical protein DE4585_01912 [Mycobacteroides salmoniphilum]|uniref:Uncharacterized protein n=1 Tax=Mycobacteroides salmoniphilum TaxID=404941 RepID=A0A4R8S8H2_9MYCO|nr:hypothetical protein DE4585_01912 [Mycobacteroides salmoniphilum]